MNNTISDFGKLKFEVREFLKQTSSFIEVNEFQIKDMVKESHYVVTHEGDDYDFYGMDTASYWFPITLRNSIFVSLYAFLEHILIKICRILEKTKGLSTSIESFKNDTNIKGPTIETARMYITNVAGINFPNQSPEWRYMKKCTILRNSIVHNFAHVNDKVAMKLPMNGVTTKIEDVANEVVGYNYFEDFGEGASKFGFENSFFLLSGFSEHFLRSFAILLNKFFRMNISLLDGRYDKEHASFDFRV
ncbi:hypothetical protein [Paenibacillus kribbensis]|uniref:hypothetical protein n=1 Tax=Paenibacillus kribbensis TaxID=172713 RepID=UPI00142E298D|nr:hypothetical protein [Paenibacillus kribbensis]